jgi:hypothetical protein
MANLAFAYWYKISYTFDAVKRVLTVESSFLSYGRVNEYPFDQVSVRVDRRQSKGVHYYLNLAVPDRLLQVHAYSAGSDAYALAARIEHFLAPSEPETEIILLPELSG